ncbi:MAG: glutaminyl-peptide cyclotransferase [Chloroflexota bacterium]|nr:glutaminyl-peptide cyclotransferase [Chloroflexota bacterium]
MRPLFVVLAVQLVVAVVFVLLIATGSLPFVNDDDPAGGTAKPGGANRFDGPAAFRLLEMQLSYGPRPAGSAQSRKLAARLRTLLPNGRFQPVPGGLRNIVGTVPGKDGKRFVVVGAHYDSKDMPGFLGANDGASGTAAVVQLARRLEPRTIGPTVKFVLFDGEESPRGTPENQFARFGLRGSKVAAREFKDAEAMILLDFVGDKELSLRREGTSHIGLWTRLRGAAAKAGVGSYFPEAIGTSIEDDHTPFLERGVPSIDLIDWDFPCFHKTCDNLSAISEKSLDASGEAVAGLLATL